MKQALLALLAAWAAAGAPPDSPWKFAFEGPLPRWQDGLPVGNGRLGAQVWGSGRDLFLTLDRGDIWDLRYVPNKGPNFNYTRLQQLVRERRQEDIQKEMSPDTGPLSDITPTRVSIGRLRIGLPEDTIVEHADLDMRDATVRWQLRVNGKPVRYSVFAPLEPPLIVATIEGADGWTPSVTMEPLGSLNRKLVNSLGYPEPRTAVDGRFSSTVQPMAEGGSICTMWTAGRRGNRWELLVAISGQEEAATIARKALEAGLERGLDRLAEEHRQAWSRRWARSGIRLPESGVERLWINGLYKLASSSYRGAPANLQGLWPPDGEIPPWRGDYHCDMNVQQTYWPAYSSNQLDLVEPLNCWLVNDVAPEGAELAKRFFGGDGVFIGCALDRQGRLLGGKSNWYTVQWALSSGAWMGQHLWWYWSYSQDRDFLARQAYPLLKRIAAFYTSVLKPGADGRLHVPLSTSPEYFSNELAAWTPDPTSDLAAVRNFFRYTIRAAEALGADESLRREWQRIEQRLAPYPQDEQGLRVQPNEPYARSHRHPMHLFPIFPGEDVTVEGSDADRSLIARSIHEWIFRGTGEWTGWSYTYGSLIASRIRRGNHALNLLEIYKKAYIWPNGFHVNGDYKRYGFSFYEYQPFTMEAECGFTAAVNEMLMQSWGGRIRIFPALPDEWKDVSFRDLRAEGGALVSAEMRGGKIVAASIESERGGKVRLAWPLGYIAPGAKTEDRVVELRSGEKRNLLP